MSVRLAFTPGAALAAGLLACQQGRGEVELNWTIVDRAGAQVFPSGELDDTCALVGLLPGASEPVAYAAQVELRLCEPGCPGGCADPACRADTLRFDCSAARGWATVDAGDDAPYDFHVALVAVPDSGGCACDLTAPCALVPGPRRRTVEPGLVTDLQVYLLVLGLDDVADSLDDMGRARLDLDACCTPDPTCAP
jgi:hypothetical protein